MLVNSEMASVLVHPVASIIIWQAALMASICSAVIVWLFILFLRVCRFVLPYVLSIRQNYNFVNRQFSFLTNLVSPIDKIIMTMYSQFIEPH